MNRELLRECFWQLKDSRASGIDRITKGQYAVNLMNNLDDLIGRLHRMAYIPQPVRRVYIPKAGSTKMRPLGIPVLEDKLVQAAMSKILQAIYKQDFIEDSYGFLPNRSCHDALRVLSQVRCPSTRPIYLREWVFMMRQNMRSNHIDAVRHRVNGIYDES